MVGQSQVPVGRCSGGPVVHHHREFTHGEATPDGQHQRLDRLHVLHRILGSEELHDRTPESAKTRRGVGEPLATDPLNQTPEESHG